MVLPMTHVSVVVPTHNRSGLLALTLRSVLWQRDVDLEVVVVDDGSTDDTAEVVAALGDPRLRRVHHPTPKGVSAARNRGIAEAGGQWVAFVDDDDLWAPDKLARQLQAARDTGRAWAYAGAVSVDGGLEIVGGVPPPSPDRVAELLPRFNAVPGGGSNVVVRRDLLRRVGPFDTRLYNTEDWEMWIRLAKDGPPAGVGSPLLAYRVHLGNASLNIPEILAGVALIERRHGTRADRGVIHHWLAESCLRTGRRKEALQHLAAAACRGQAGAVARDVGAIARRRLRRHLGRPPSALPSRTSQWAAPAAAWLAELAAEASKARERRLP
jgi:glycosyltransferase involved in cell wall biosynthesis